MKSNLLRGSWIVTLPLVALAAAYFYFLFLPGQREIARLADELALQRQFVQGSVSGVAAIRATAGDLERCREYTAEWAKNAPVEGDLADLLARITSAAKHAGTTITRLEPDRPVRYEHVSRVPVVVGLAGSFSQVGRLICDLERLPQTLWIQEVRIEIAGKDGENVQCEMVVEIFADNPGDSGQVKLSG